MVAMSKDDDEFPYGSDGERWIDIGHDHLILPTVQQIDPDAEIDGEQPTEPAGWLIAHRTPGGDWCCGSVNRPESRAHLVDKHAAWTVESEDPLTLSPSIMCSCGDHGYIREGHWETV